MDKLELQVDLREAGGKGAARRTRAKGHVPAVVYGIGADTITLQVDERRLSAIVRMGANQIIDLKGPDGFEDRLVLLKELQQHPVSRQLIHADFYTVDTSKTIEVDIPIVLEGKCIGVELGGVLDLVIRDLHVTCMPLAIPSSFSVDVTEMNIGDSRNTSDIVLPEGVVLAMDPDLTLVQVATPRVEETPEEEEGAEDEAAAAADGDKPAAEGAAESSGS